MFELKGSFSPASPAGRFTPRLPLLAVECACLAVVF